MRRLGEYVLPHLTTRLHLTECRGDAERTVEVEGGENHALALDAHHLAGSEVGNEQHILAYELFRLVDQDACNTSHNLLVPNEEVS